MAAIAPLALGAGIAGSGVSAIGSIMGGEAKGNAAAYQAQVASNNAEIARRNAAYSEAAGNAQAQASGFKSAAKQGAIKTAQAASGIDVNRGSAVNVQASERELGQLDTETVLNNAMLQNYGYRSQATNFEAQSGLDTMEAKEAPVAGDLAAAGSVLGSASSLGLKWSQLGPSKTGGGAGGDY